MGRPLEARLFFHQKLFQNTLKLLSADGNAITFFMEETVVPPAVACDRKMCRAKQE